MAGEINSDVNIRGNLESIYHDKDIWRNIALKLDRRSFYRLICSWKWFAVVVIADESLWRDLLLRDLGVTLPVPRNLDMEDGVTWKNTYASVFGPPPPYDPIYIDSHRLIAGARLGGAIMSSEVWMGALDDEFTTVKSNQHGYFVSNLLPGLWIADVYTGRCPVCAECGEIKTILTLWHSKLYLMDGFNDFCPNIMRSRYTDLRGGCIIDPSTDDLDLANLAILCYNIDGLNLEYKVSGKGLTVDFIDINWEGFETDFKVTRDGNNRVVTIQIEHIGRHVVTMEV